MYCEHADWLVFQRRRKARMMGDYLATVPESLRQKICDSVAPDARDLGINMPATRANGGWSWS